MKTVEELKAWLQLRELPCSFENTGTRIDSPSPEGFPVWIGRDNDEWTVAFGEGWHGHFPDEASAVECAINGVTGRIRETTWRRGGFPYRWTAHQMVDGQWKLIDSITVCFFPFWKPRNIEYRQNPVTDLE